MPRYTDGYREFSHYWCTESDEEFELVELESDNENLNQKRIRNKLSTARQSMKTKNTGGTAGRKEQVEVVQLDAKKRFSELKEEEKMIKRNAAERRVGRELGDYSKLTADLKGAMDGHIGPSPPTSPPLSSSPGSSLHGLDTSDHFKPTLDGTTYGKVQNPRKDRVDGPNQHKLKFSLFKSPTVAEAYSKEGSQEFEDVPLEDPIESDWQL